MQISLKLIQAINHAKSTVCIKFLLLVTFSSLFTASSSLSVLTQSVLYLLFRCVLVSLCERVSIHLLDDQSDRWLVRSLFFLKIIGAVQLWHCWMSMFWMCWMCWMGLMCKDASLAYWALLIGFHRNRILCNHGYFIK